MAFVLNQIGKLYLEWFPDGKEPKGSMIFKSLPGAPVGKTIPLSIPLNDEFIPQKLPIEEPKTYSGFFNTGDTLVTSPISEARPFDYFPITLAFIPATPPPASSGASAGPFFVDPLSNPLAGRLPPTGSGTPVVVSQPYVFKPSDISNPVGARIGPSISIPGTGTPVKVDIPAFGPPATSANPNIPQFRQPLYSSIPLPAGVPPTGIPTIGSHIEGLPNDLASFVQGTIRQGAIPASFSNLPGVGGNANSIYAFLALAHKQKIPPKFADDFSKLPKAWQSGFRWYYSYYGSQFYAELAEAEKAALGDLSAYRNLARNPDMQRGLAKVAQAPPNYTYTFNDILTAGMSEEEFVRKYPDKPTRIDAMRQIAQQKLNASFIYPDTPLDAASVNLGRAVSLKEAFKLKEITYEEFLAEIQYKIIRNPTEVEKNNDLIDYINRKNIELKLGKPIVASVRGGTYEINLKNIRQFKLPQPPTFQEYRVGVGPVLKREGPTAALNAVGWAAILFHLDTERASVDKVKAAFDAGELKEAGYGPGPSDIGYIASWDSLTKDAQAQLLTIYELKKSRDKYEEDKRIYLETAKKEGYRIAVNPQDVKNKVQAFLNNAPARSRYNAFMNRLELEGRIRDEDGNPISLTSPSVTKLPNIQDPNSSAKKYTNTIEFNKDLKISFKRQLANRFQNIISNSIQNIAEMQGDTDSFNRIFEAMLDGFQAVEELPVSTLISLGYIKPYNRNLVGKPQITDRIATLINPTDVMTVCSGANRIPGILRLRFTTTSPNLLFSAVLNYNAGMNPTSTPGYWAGSTDQPGQCPDGEFTLWCNELLSTWTLRWVQNMDDQINSPGLAIASVTYNPVRFESTADFVTTFCLWPGPAPTIIIEP